MHKTIELAWCVGHTDVSNNPPAQWVPASIPGAANLDWINANDLPDWKRGVNFEQYRWMEDCYWVYRTTLCAQNEVGFQTLLRGKGIDYAYKIYLDDSCIYEYEGMYAPFCLDLTGKSGVLEIWISPVPKDAQGTPNTREEAAQVCKPAVSYGWDWHPRLIPMGVWDELTLTQEPICRFEDASISYQLAEDYSTVDVCFSHQLTGAAVVQCSLYAPTGEQIVCTQDTESIRIEQPLLWWCNGYGAPNLYSWKMECIVDGAVLDVRTGQVGFRNICMTMNEGGWMEPQEFPKSRSVAPITVCLNGVAIFAKGSNWVNPEIFVGTITKETYEKEIVLGKQLHFNMFRCWGGAIVNKDAFYALCDQHGIMVWQELMLACNNYRGTPQYLSVLEQEATAVIKRLRQYTSVVLWCAGNELFNDWSGMTDQSLALRLLNKLCYDLDPQKRPYLMTSPLFGMAHGCYLFRYPDGREVFEVMPAAKQTAYTEFGVPSVSNLDCCLQIAPEDELFPMVPNETTIAHHAFDAWHAAKDTWCGVDTIRHYLGEPSSLQSLIDDTQWLQGEGYKCIYEESRRQKPYCSMALNWCFNEPWPTLANNSLLNYGGKPKASCQEVAAACRPILASAQIPHFSWEGGEVFEAGLWMLNDSLSEIAAGTVTATLLLNGETYPLLTWAHDTIAANTNAVGPVIRFVLPKEDTVQKTQEKQLNISPSKQAHSDVAQKMQLVLQAGTAQDAQAYSSCYTLIYYA